MGDVQIMSHALRVGSESSSMPTTQYAQLSSRLDISAGEAQMTTRERFCRGLARVDDGPAGDAADRVSRSQTVASPTAYGRIREASSSERGSRWHSPPVQSVQQLVQEQAGTGDMTTASAHDGDRRCMWRVPLVGTRRPGSAFSDVARVGTTSVS